MPKKNIVVCIPSGRCIDPGFFRSFANSLGQMMLTWNTAVLPVSSPYISENRNEILRRALSLEEKTPGFLIDYFLWLDDDIVFNFEQVKNLIQNLEQGADFISGVYYNPKDSGIKPVAYFKDGEGYAWLEEKDLGGLKEVDAVGFGFCAFKADLARKVFEKYKPRPFDMRYLENGSVVTEDQIFCERVKEFGAKILLDSELIVKHAKGYLPR